MLLGKVVVNSPSRIQGLEESTIINKYTNRTLRAHYSSSNPSGSNILFLFLVKYTYNFTLSPLKGVKLLTFNFFYAKAIFY